MLKASISFMKKFHRKKAQMTIGDRKLEEFVYSLHKL